MRTTLDLMGPNSPPKPVLSILLTTLCFSLLTALLNPFFSYFDLSTPHYLFSLSLSGMKSGYLWQILTFLFLQEGGGNGIHFGYLLGLFFNLAILWFIGTSLCETYGKRSFYWFYIGCGVIGGLCGLLGLALTGTDSLLSGPTPALLALLLAWAMLNPEAEILLFFLIPIKAKWLALGTVGAFLLIYLSQWDLVHFLFYLGGAFSGYLYALTVWDLESPFPWSKQVDTPIRYLGKKIQRLFVKSSTHPKSKIIDIKTGTVLMEEDDAFMDRMLNKIARNGVNSLSAAEKKRMKLISEKKIRENKQ